MRLAAHNVFLSASLMLLPVAALAQVQEAGGESYLEEVTVTAQKREQSMQDVGIAVTAFTGDRLQEMGIDSVAKMQYFTPNLRISPTITGVPQYSIRGVGENADTSALSSSPVALHINEVAQPYPVAISNLLFDLQRVEVLRGPQGDLFGLNSTAGTINWITNKASQEFSSSIMGEVGNYQRWKAEGFINGGIGETVSARFAFSYNNRGKGWQANEATGERLGEFKKTGARLSFNFAPSDTFDADLEFHYSREDSDAMGMRNVSNFLALDVPALLSGLDPILVATPAQDYNGTGWTSYTRGVEYEAIGLVNTDLFPSYTVPYIDRKGYGGSLIMNWDLDSVAITSVTGYENFDREELNDSDGSEYQDSGQFFTSDLKMWSQELRVASNTDGDVHWLVGANAASDELDQLTMFVQTENLDFPGVGGQSPTQKRDIWALFSHVDWRFADQWELVAGLRYTSEKRKQTNISTYKMGQPTDGVELLSGFVFAPDYNDPFALGTPLTDGNFLCFVDPDNFACEAGEVLHKDIDFKEWSGKVGLNYFANEDWMLYGSFARGFKSGGFLDTAASNSESFINTEAEFLNAWELGAKGDLADGRARLNLAVFYYDYEDQQVGDSLVDPLFGPLGRLRNAPRSEVYGGELEFLWVPTENLEIMQNLGYSKGKFKEFIGVDADASRDTINDPDGDGFYHTVYIDRAGDQIEMPNWQYSGTVAYNWGLSSGMGMRFVVDYSYEDKVKADRNWTDDITGEVSNFSLPSYWLVNARLSLLSADTWEVTLFGANLLDEEYLLDYTRFNQSVVQMVGLPRTWGLRFRYDF